MLFIIEGTDEKVNHKIMKENFAGESVDLSKCRYGGGSYVCECEAAV